MGGAPVNRLKWVVNSPTPKWDPIGASWRACESLSLAAPATAPAALAALSWPEKLSGQNLAGGACAASRWHPRKSIILESKK